jgi:hypothetical protein
LGVNAWYLLDAAIYLAAGTGIWRMSRASACIAFGWYSLGLVGSIVSGVSPDALGRLIGVLLFGRIYLNSIRATFAYRRMIAADLPQTPMQPILPPMVMAQAATAHRPTMAEAEYGRVPMWQCFIHCPMCGRKRELDGRYCAGCGADLKMPA